jgi:hypothetical protein
MVRRGAATATSTATAPHNPAVHYAMREIYGTLMRKFKSARAPPASRHFDT